MTNNLDKEFKKLQKLNAQIDVWIDDEEYDKVYNAFQINDEAVYKDTSLRSVIIDLFREDVINTHENELDEKWRIALGYKENILPIIQADGKNFTIQESNDNDELDQYWSHLFYAKLLRTKIQQRGSSDCYTRRLDDVAAYLERHLPRYSVKSTTNQEQKLNERVTRLTLMYLMELSAASQDWESLGFSERAHRVITDAKHSFGAKKAKEKAPYNFYDLWAHYNIGVAYFHQGYYRKAVLEFNDIIWQKQYWEKNESKPEYKQNLEFFQEHHGIELLYLPAILYRAEVQLKLQFAYHSLDTLNKYFWNNEEISSHKKISAMIIEAQAYQQMGRLDKSWGVLDGDGNSKVEEKREGICKLVTGDVQLGQRKCCIIPERDKLNQRFPGLGGRFIDILIADHLDWLTFRGEDSKQSQLKLTELVKRGDAESYLERLKNAFSSYFEVVEYHAYNRRGYFQQLARYLAWLAKGTDLRLSSSNYPSYQNKSDKSRNRIAKIAKELYNKAKEDGLLFGEDELDKPQNGCRYCQAKGIDLRRIESEHYAWFTEDMLEFFNFKDIFKPGEIDKDKKEFVGRLIKREWKDKDDMRIRDLKLRYEFYEKDELLTKLSNDNDIEYARKLCFGELGTQAGLLNFPICNQEINENQEHSNLTASRYIDIMQEGNKKFLEQLKSPSIHEKQEGGFYFLGLQRWNSTSPAKGYSIGGGYLLYHLNKENKKVDMGIAIDPGFDFIRNLFHMGFNLDDIDIVLISHAHLDHIRDFESIIMLLYELRKRDKREKRVHVILSLGAYKRLEHIVEDPELRYFMEPYIIDVEREINDDYFEKKMQVFSFRPVTNGEHGNLTNMERLRAVLPEEKEQHYNGFQVTITPTRAYHDDRTNYSDSFGCLINLAEKVEEQNGEEKQSNLTFGYTGDTRWVYPNMPDLIEEGESEDKREERAIEDIAKQYENCDVLLVHLGSLIGRDDDGKLSFAQYDQCGTNTGNRYRCEELVREKDHPYLIGMLRLLSSFYGYLPEEGSIGDRKGMPLVLVSEFGEELRETIRTDFIQRLQRIYGRRISFLPVDVGLKVYLHRKDDVPADSRGSGCVCTVWCVQCKNFVNIDDADLKLRDTDAAVYCICKTCYGATPVDLQEKRLREIYEEGLGLDTQE